MSNKSLSFTSSLLVSFFLSPLLTARSQTLPTSGLYQIMSGNYVECCGIGGDVLYSLPTSNQSFVKLTVEPQDNLATLTFLGDDGQTPFRIVPCPPNGPIDFNFNYGLILADRVVFQVDPGPPPYQISWNYMISNSTNGLRIDGVLGTLQAPCADVPTRFTHSNLVAVLVPTPAIRVSEVEVCWGTRSNINYQVQYRSALTTNAWINLGSPRMGNGSTDCLADKVTPGQPQRFYRVVPVR